MTKLLFLVLSFSGPLAFAQTSTCIVNSQNEYLALESVVTLQGTVKLNPMFLIEDLSFMTEEQESVQLLLKPARPVLLEQWSDTADTLACESKTVTMVLNKEQRKQVTPALLSPDIKEVQITGTIRWSESSLELAGNAVLMNITKISVEP